ncbi:L-2-hydroxyglutarate oxidase [Bacteroidota bacterium]
MEYDIIVIGGGIIGVATSVKLLRERPDLKLLVLEKEQELAAHQTGNNSGVIHSGLYYRPGSLKAKNCVNGYKQLLDFCNQEDIPYDICGKIVVATSQDELPALDTLLERGKQNGLKGLKLIENEELREHEPNVNGIKGIFVPQTGIIDFKEVTRKIGERVVFRGGDIKFSEKVLDIIKKRNTNIVITSSGTHKTNMVVNCAGLYSDKVASMTENHLDVRIIPFRGEYYKIRKERHELVKNLIYPVPDPSFPFLGVHFTRMINGGIEAGPNAVLAMAREGYKKTDINLKELGETLAWPGFLKVASKYWKTGFDEMVRSYSRKAFAQALQKLIPGISEQDLVAGGAGVRAQACDRSGNLLDDFRIIENDVAVNVLNAPSPAATSALSIGDTISNIVLKRFE